jgi:hypothetical protein
MLLFMMKLPEPSSVNLDIKLRPEQIADVKRIRDDLRNGRTRLATDEEIAALWKQCGL